MKRLYSREMNGLAERGFSREARWDRLEMLKSSGGGRVWEAGEVQRRKACLWREGGPVSQRRVAYVYEIVN
jgi:hypothetical protein